MVYFWSYWKLRAKPEIVFKLLPWFTLFSTGRAAGHFLYEFILPAYSFYSHHRRVFNLAQGKKCCDSCKMTKFIYISPAGSLLCYQKNFSKKLDDRPFGILCHSRTFHDHLDASVHLIHIHTRMFLEVSCCPLPVTIPCCAHGSSHPGRSKGRRWGREKVETTGKKVGDEKMLQKPARSGLKDWKQ